MVRLIVVDLHWHWQKRERRIVLEKDFLVVLMFSYHHNKYRAFIFASKRADRLFCPAFDHTDFT